MVKATRNQKNSICKTHKVNKFMLKGLTHTEFIVYATPVLHHATLRWIHQLVESVIIGSSFHLLASTLRHTFPQAPYVGYLSKIVGSKLTWMVKSLPNGRALQGNILRDSNDAFNLAQGQEKLLMRVTLITIHIPYRVILVIPYRAHTLLIRTLMAT